MQDPNIPANLRSSNWFQQWMGARAAEKLKERGKNPVKKDDSSSVASVASSVFTAKEKKNKETSPSKAGTETVSTGGISEDVLPFLNVIAKNSIVLPGMARDMNVLRQNIAKLVNLKGKESKVKAEGKADKFFQTEDAREAKLEEERKKNTPTKDGKEKKEPKEEKKEGGGLLSGLMDMLNPINLLKGLFMGIVGAFGALFSGGSIFAILSKIFLPAMIIGGLINGIMDGINTWKETGSSSQGFIAHELAEVCPDAVTGEKDAINRDGSIKPQGVDTSFLVATLTAAIQELKAELDSVKAELQTLKGN